MHLHTDSEPDFNTQIELHAFMSTAVVCLFGPRMEKETLVLEGLHHDLRKTHAAVNLRVPSLCKGLQLPQIYILAL